MKSYKEVYDGVLPKEKKESERRNVVLYTIVRPLTIYATLPFIGKNINPTSITKVSVVCSLLGFAMLAMGKSLLWNILGWLAFFTWVILDGVDGNLARYEHKTSQMGEVWDAFGGYVAMVLTFFGIGIAAFYDQNTFVLFEPYWMLILGGATSVISIFPRLMMHKVRETVGSKASTTDLTNKTSFGLVKSIAMNFISLSGLFQILFFIAIIFHLLNVFILVYFILNLGMMLVTLRSLLKE